MLKHRRSMLKHNRLMLKHVSTDIYAFTYLGGACVQCEFRSFRLVFAMSVNITRCLSVAGGAHAQPWVITDLEIIGGTEFVPLSVCDSGFNRFVTGSCKGLHGKSGFLVKLRELRTKATIQACCKQEGESLFEQTAAAAKRQRRQSREASCRGDVPSIVEVVAPKVEYDEAVFEPVTIKMQASLDMHATLRVEVTPAVLEYIKAGILAETDRARKTKSTAECPVRWREDRSCFFATKTVDGKHMYKTFRPDGDGDDDKDAALRLAREWMEEK